MKSCYLLLYFPISVGELFMLVSFECLCHSLSFILVIVQARSLPTDKLRIFYVSVNGAVYFIQVCCCPSYTASCKLLVSLGFGSICVVDFMCCGISSSYIGCICFFICASLECLMDTLFLFFFAPFS